MRWLFTALCFAILIKGTGSRLRLDHTKLNFGEGAAFDEVALISGCDGKSTILERAWILETFQREGNALTVILADWRYDFQSEYVRLSGYEIEDPNELFGLSASRLRSASSCERIEEASISILSRWSRGWSG